MPFSEINVGNRLERLSVPLPYLRESMSNPKGLTRCKATDVAAHVLATLPAFCGICGCTRTRLMSLRCTVCLYLQLRIVLQAQTPEVASTRVQGGPGKRSSPRDHVLLPSLLSAPRLLFLLPLCKHYKTAPKGCTAVTAPGHLKCGLISPSGGTQHVSRGASLHV